MKHWAVLGVVGLGIVVVASCSSPKRDFDSTVGGQSGGGGAGAPATPDQGGDAGSLGGHPSAGGSARAGAPGAAGEAGEAGMGTAPDACINKPCDSPPDNGCVSGSKFKAYDTVGSCKDGDCSYASHEIACTCKSDACTTDPCVGAPPCDSPPAPKCLDADTLTKYASAGTCTAGSCSYGTIDVPCSFGCADGACKGDPCAGVMCDKQTPAICKDATTVETYAASDTCSKGKCSYAATDAACAANKACGGAGLCTVCKTDSSCGDSCGVCPGQTPKCKDLGATSQCVACLVDTECGLGICDYVGNICLASPTGCNTLVQKGPVVESTATAAALPAGTRGTILAGTYLLSGFKGFGGQFPSEGATLVVGVSGNTVTLNSYDHYFGMSISGGNSPSRWTATFVASGVSLTLQYSCFAPENTPPAIQGFDYSVVNSTTLQLIFPLSTGVGYVITYTKQ